MATLIAVDTNILVYAHRPECASHERAFAALRELAASSTSWGVPLHCLIEFAGVVSNAKIWKQPSSPAQIQAQVEAWREAPTLHILEETAEWWPVFVECVAASGARGAQVHDARIAAVCKYHGVGELWTADRDFGRFPWLRTRNPLV